MTEFLLGAQIAAETAALRDKYQTKLNRIQTQLQAADDRAHVLHTEQRGRQSQAVLSTAGSILGGAVGAAGRNVSTLSVSLERTDVRVTQLNLVWVPVP